MKSKNKNRRPVTGEFLEVDSAPVFGAGGEREWERAQVADVLSTQFTAVEVATKSLIYRFYVDQGQSWRFID